MAMVLVITILAALLGIAAVGLSIQLNSTKSIGLIKDTRASLYCAEAGLQAARDIIVSNRKDWNKVLSNTPGLSWYQYPDGGPTNPEGITGDADGDGITNDYSVTFVDDGDDADPTTDDNDTIVVTSKCLLYDDMTPVSITEVLSLRGLGHIYRNQSGGGPGNTGNENQ